MLLQSGWEKARLIWTIYVPPEEDSSGGILFLQILLYSPRTLSCASDRALVRLNTVGLLKRAALERKKSDGAYRALYSLASLRFAL